MEIAGRKIAEKFSRKHAAARKPLTRLLDIIEKAQWKHIEDLHQTFPSADYAPKTGTVIFNVGGNKYRLIAVVDFSEQLFLVDEIHIHKDYDRKER